MKWSCLPSFHTFSFFFFCSHVFLPPQSTHRVCFYIIIFCFFYLSMRWCLVNKLWVCAVGWQIERSCSFASALVCALLIFDDSIALGTFINASTLTYSPSVDGGEKKFFNAFELFDLLSPLCLFRRKSRTRGVWIATHRFLTFISRQSFTNISFYDDAPLICHPTRHCLLPQPQLYFILKRRNYLTFWWVSLPSS